MSDKKKYKNDNMKKYLLLIAVFSITFTTQAQTISRDKVIVEIGTGTWCQYCPGAALGADDLIANGKQVAIIEYHGPSGSDSYANTYSVARNSYYAISGYPTAWFDGGNAVVGGDHTISMYSYYLPKYNQRIAINSYFTITLYGNNTGNNYNIAVVVEKVRNYTGTNPVLQFALTQSNIPYSWQGMSELNYVERLMVPNQNGTALNFSSGNVNVISLTFTKNASWPEDDCELVAFVQNNTTKEVLQGTKSALNTLQSLATDAALTSVYNLPVMACSGKANPYLKIKNTTNLPLYSASIKYRINDGATQTYSWAGNLGLNQETLFSLPQMNFSGEFENTFVAYIQNANGLMDLNHQNDTITETFGEANEYFASVNLELKTDNYPEQTTWQVINSLNQIIFSGGPYTGQPNTIIQEEFTFQMPECYRFVISDSGNDGICCSSGNGYYQLSNNNIPFYTGGNFGPKETTEFSIQVTVLSLNLLIEGPFDENTFEMSTTLNENGLIPFFQPYNVAPWNYYGTESVESIPNPDIVDWILVELRETNGGPETATSSTIVGRQAAFVEKNGNVVGLDGASLLRFDVEISKNLYVVIYHRNDLAIMSASPLNNATGTFYYDFTSGVNFIYGGSAGCKDIFYGISGMASGDANGDGTINIEDVNDTWGIYCGRNGYFPGDFDMNKQINNQDKNRFIISNYNLTSQVPE